MKFTFQPESRPLAGYTLKRGIARGGFGEVYYALSDAGKEVAVKLLQHNLDIELRGVQQCLNLRHPNLVAIFDVKTDADSDHWVVMEYISGQTLEQALQTQKGPMPVDHIERWLVGLAGGLGYLHDRGIVHRDVKPGNIFWDQGSIKLGDVGLSKFMTPSRRSAHTESVGTVYYMAPEVTYGKYGYEVDIYSVGVMLYEMLSGQLPFDGQSTGEILMKHLSEPPNLNIISAQFRPMLAAVLEKDPKKRTGTMGKLLSDFRLAKSGGPVPVAASRQSGFAAYPTLPKASLQPTIHTTTSRPGTVTSALPVGSLATNLGSFLGADPRTVQVWVSGLFNRGLFYAAILVGIAVVTKLTGGIALVMLMIGSALAAVVLVPISGIALLVSPDLRGRVWGRLMGPAEVSNSAPESRPLPHGVAALPVAVPVRQVVSPRPAPPAPVAPCRVDRMTLRLADLSGSLSWATVLAIVFAAGTGFLSPLFGSAASLHPDLGKLGLFTLTTLIAVWTILVVSKLTAGNRLSNHHRRLVNLVAGAVVGSVAWWLSTVLMVEMSARNLDHQAMFDSIGRQPLALNNQPTWLGFAIFFGLLFAGRRWWWHADPNRPAMFRIMSVLRTIVVAAILPVICVFPWDWAVTWAAVMSCVVQLSAAWIPEELRDRLPRRDHRGTA
ncbi:MAG: prkC 18 [Planctomycetaceae bacterium]|nr:prkC 18 [Planctomycetaceae bacterium]